jgi:hypothetical protein
MIRLVLHPPAATVRTKVLPEDSTEGKGSYAVTDMLRLAMTRLEAQEHIVLVGAVGPTKPPGHCDFSKTWVVLPASCSCWPCQALLLVIA